MKYTDSWFKFPIKVYDHNSLEEARKAEEEDGIRIDAVYAKSYYRVLPDEIAGWMDTVSRPGTAEQGCNATLVWFNDGSDMVCVWNSQKFEDKLNAFVEKQDKELFDMAEEEDKEETDDNNSITD